MEYRKVRSWQVVTATMVGVCLWAGTAQATVPLLTGFGGTRDYGTNCLSPNDDGSSALVDISAFFPGGLRFFTATPHTAVYVNTNGNITFSGAEPEYTPAAFPVADRPMIAAYWADVDLRPLVDTNCRGYGAYTGSPGDGPCQNPPENGAWWYLESGRMVITWDRVGYYSCRLNRRMDFQMILTAVEGCGGTSGDFDVEFRFQECGWNAGTASGGTDGFWTDSGYGQAAQVGFDAGNSVDYVEVPGSRTTTIQDIVCEDSNVGEPGRWVYQIRGGTVICPDAGDPCTMPGALGVCAEGRTSCVGAGTECVGNLTPSDERCNALDDDCDGETDEGDGLCASYEICDHGVCRTVCSEFGCPPGEICGDDGRCIDELCVGVTCDPGLRCVDGNCVGACEGIVCPVGTVCIAGSCVDLCATLVCDECSVCVDGVCVTRCEWAACAAGETCLADGRCVTDACASMTCDPGFYCVDGGCVDECAGAVCPASQVCVAGACVPDVRPDADADADMDGGADADADADADAAPDVTGDARDGSDVSHPPADESGVSCNCRTSAAPGSGGSLLGLAALLAGLVLRRRR
jgi:MYXO-CTERM domain-containing protein